MKVKINRLSTLDRVQALKRLQIALKKGNCRFFRGKFVGIALPDPRLKW